MKDGAFDSKKVGIKILLCNSVTDLPLKSNIELVLSDGFEHRAVVIGSAVFHIQSHINGLCCDGSFKDFFPGHFKVQSRSNNVNYREIITGSFLFI